MKIAMKYKTPARWRKAIQHAKEAGKIESSPRDIPILLKEIGVDVYQECAEHIKNEIFSWAWPKIQRMINQGFPEWYKEELLRNAFNEPIPQGDLIAAPAPLPPKEDSHYWECKKNEQVRNISMSETSQELPQVQGDQTIEPGNDSHALATGNVHANFGENDATS